MQVRRERDGMLIIFGLSHLRLDREVDDDSEWLGYPLCSRKGDGLTMFIDKLDVQLMRLADLARELMR